MMSFKLLHYFCHVWIKDTFRHLENDHDLSVQEDKMHSSPHTFSFINVLVGQTLFQMYIKYIKTSYIKYILLCCLRVKVQFFLCIR